MSEENISQVMPQISVDSVDRARKFYIERLGFEHMMGVVGKDGEFDFCIVTRQGAAVMLNRPMEVIEGIKPEYPTKRPVDLYITVNDVDSYFEEVKGKGAQISAPLTTQWWGDRNFAVSDPYGYQVWFCQSISEPQPPPGVKLV